MKKNSLTPNKGLSLSQAQSISNLCNQRAREIDAKLSIVNNYKKTIEIADKPKPYILQTGTPLPIDVVNQLKEKASLHACQAFLMENIKAKDIMLKAAKMEIVDVSGLEVPEKPNIFSPLVNQLSEVNEDFGWSQLSVAELNEYVEAEAFAAHIGKFYHQDGILDKLRKELPLIPSIEWMVINDGMKSPITIEVHHNAEDLMKTHEELATLHRAYEQRVNYFKAKVKNLTTEENARIAKHNADAQNESANINNQLQSTYDTAFKAYSEKVKSTQAEFEKNRQANIKEIASLRIEIDGRFQKTVDTFLGQLSKTEE